MTVLVIRAHKRFGVCRKVRLRRESCVIADADGLLIELSLEGCRISNVDSDSFCVEDVVEVDIGGYGPLSGQVRWQHDGMIGLRLVDPLHNSELADLVQFCRGEADMKVARRV